MEVESKVRRWEEILREGADKRHAFEQAGERRPIHFVLVLPPTRHHRALLRTLPASTRAALPIDAGELRRTFTGGGPWPGDRILWVPGGARSVGAG